MKITLLKDFTAQTTEGPHKLPAGKILDLSEDKAAALIAAEIAERADLPGPYLNQYEQLVIPMNCPTRYKWWTGGQSVAATLQELHEERTTENTDYQPSPERGPCDEASNNNSNPA